jgi:hypothetical protein
MRKTLAELVDEIVLAHEALCDAEISKDVIRIAAARVSLGERIRAARDVHKNAPRASEIFPSSPNRLRAAQRK